MKMISLPGGSEWLLKLMLFFGCCANVRIGRFDDLKMYRCNQSSAPVPEEHLVGSHTAWRCGAFRRNAWWVHDESCDAVQVCDATMMRKEPMPVNKNPGPYNPGLNFIDGPFILP